MYSGGLGVLAGDLLKEASDQALPARRGGSALSQGLLPSARRPIGLATRILDRSRPRDPARGPRLPTGWFSADDPDPDLGRPGCRHTFGGSIWDAFPSTCSTLNWPRTPLYNDGSARGFTKATVHPPGAVRGLGGGRCPRARRHVDRSHPLPSQRGPCRAGDAGRGIPVARVLEGPS